MSASAFRTLIDDFERRLRRGRFFLQASFAYFPWTLAIRSYVLLAAIFLAGLVGTLYSIRHVAIETLVAKQQTAVPEEAGPQALLQIEFFDEAITVRFLIFLTMGLLGLLILTYTAYRPMARVIRATKRGLSGHVSDAAPDDSHYIDEPGEWIELEQSIASLAKNVKSRESDLAREREELITILSSVSEAIVAMGRDTRPVYFNSRFALLFGAGSTGGDAPPLRERFRIPDLLGAIEKVLAEGGTRTLRVRMRTELHEGEREFSVAISPLISRGGEEPSARYGAVAVFHDITELRATEQIRIDFVANASHELRTPLTSIKGYVETARQDLLENRSDDAQAFLAVAARNVDRLIALVNDLLDLSALESGAEVAKETVSTQEVTEAALRVTIDKRSKRHLVQVECRVPKVIGDFRRIEQVLINLVDNATKYSQEGREVRIIWEAGDGASRHDVILRVRDSGPGIPEEHIPRLFERFYRVDQGRAREVGGTGLGLAIVKHIVLSHGGSIAVKSRLGEGSEFICRFPINPNK